VPIDPPRGIGALIGAFGPAASGRVERAPARKTVSTAARDANAFSVQSELQRIADGLNVEDAESRARARVQAVRVLLQRELGPQIREYPEWSSLVERVSGAIAAAPEVDQRLVQWLAAMKQKNLKSP
jgi:hypothetical protein